MINMNHTPGIDFKTIKHIHFVGIGGCGMSGIAEILHRQGYKVTGSDINDSKYSMRLADLGIKIFKDHLAENIEQADLIVLSSAIQAQNPELIAARQRNIPTLQRAQMLAQLMNHKCGIAIAGTHGKTTTTSFVTSALLAAKLDPTFIIGGYLASHSSNAYLGTGDYIIAEADESDASFLYLNPKIIVVTNIDIDHIWAYNADFEQLKQTFKEFLHRLPEDGLAIICIDDANAKETIPYINRPVLTYGFAKDADIRAFSYKQEGLTSHFNVLIPGCDEAIKVKLNMPGQHNVENALATIAVAYHLQADMNAVIKALENFQGVGRRFQMRGFYLFAKGRALLIDDYGHHPREIAATIKAVKAVWSKKRLVMVFQPQRYTRTHSLFNDFANVLATVDKLILLDVYAAGEAVIKGAEGQTLFAAIKERGANDAVFVANKEALTTILQETLLNDDILILQGAGDIGQMAAALPVVNERVEL